MRSTLDGGLTEVAALWTLGTAGAVTARAQRLVTGEAIPVTVPSRIPIPGGSAETEPPPGFFSQFRKKEKPRRRRGKARAARAIGRRRRPTCSTKRHRRAYGEGCRLVLFYDIHPYGYFHSIFTFLVILKLFYTLGWSVYKLYGLTCYIGESNAEAPALSDERLPSPPGDHHRG